VEILRKASLLVASTAMIGGLVVVAAPAEAATCTAGVGNTAVWARCTGSGAKARLSYWCKTSPFGSAWQLYRTGYYNTPVTISRECRYEAASPYVDQIPA
jgi:hypothetical protein